MSASDLSPDELQQLLLDFALLRTGVIVTWATTALMLYDYFLTFPAELRYIWSSKKSIVFYLFIALRYAAICYSVLSCFSTVTNDVRGCEVNLDFGTVLWLISEIGKSGTFILRCYAIWNRNTVVFVTLGVLALIQCFLGAFSSFRAQTTVNEDVFALLSTCSTSGPPDARRYDIASLISIATFNTLVVVLTVSKTLQQCCHSYRFGLRRGYSYFILCDGLVYYFIIEVCVVVGLVSYFVDSPSIGLEICGDIEGPLAILITERFLLNLRQTADEEQTATAVAANLGHISFARGSFIGNIGSPMRTVQEGNEEELGQEGHCISLEDRMFDGRIDARRQR